MSQRKGGTIQLQVAGVLLDALGSFSYNLGHPMREDIVGSDRVHGYTEKPQVAFIEGEITDRGTLDLGALIDTTLATVTLSLANGKTIMLRDAWYAGDGTGNTEGGNVAVKFCSASQGEEVS